MSALTIRLRAAAGDFGLAVSMAVPDRGVTGVFGPSGSGKTTLLRCIAGLHPTASGSVRWDGGGDVWQDEATGVFRPPHERRVGYVSQHADLFPHLSVTDNLRYGLARVKTRERRLSWDDAIDGLGLASLLARRVDGLSGGERQRVALGRALLAEPKILLLDEPLSALDEPARREVLHHLGPVLGTLDLPVMYVSHALRDVARLANHFVWIRNGTVDDVAPVGAVLGRLDVAAWLGEERSVVLDGRIRGHDREFSLSTIETALGDLAVPRRTEPTGTPVRLQIAAKDVSVGLLPQESSSILNEMPLVVREVAELSESDCLVQLQGRGEDAPVLVAKITRKSRAQLSLVPGKAVFARVKSVAVLE